MKQLCRFRVTTKKYDVQDNSSLLATSHLFGLVFVGVPDKLVVIKVADLVQIDHASSKKSEILSFPSKEILLPSKPIFVALSCDNLTLMVCLQMSGCAVGWMYDVRGFARQVILYCFTRYREQRYNSLKLCPSDRRMEPIPRS